MTKKKNIMIIFISLLSISFCILFSLLYCRNKLKLVKVPIATYSLGKRTLIEEMTYEVIEAPAVLLNDEIIIDEDFLKNKCVRIDAFIPKGSFFYKSFLEDVGKVSDNLVYDLKNDEVVYDINANDLKVNQAYLKEGMYIDIYFTINKDKVVSDLLINNIKIIGLYDLNHMKIMDYDDNAILQNIVLAIPYDAVSYLNKAQAIGYLNIVVGKDCYEDVDSKLNKNSIIFEYLK